ncbi:hypothetical protein L3Q82_020163 [Scortum barcoo]|uniref:Uncharacterized protein n=1 Tax=Scortum barcoo TaxID=214431 RepID=A0ACB8VCS5_9TELE|nr:hypothetical protein L3Q82_020163 [Scortum barcoo]
MEPWLRVRSPDTVAKSAKTSRATSTNSTSLVCMELGAEKSKMASLEARLKAELSAQIREVAALQARMQTADQEHQKNIQQLNQKIGRLQDQLENGPNAQLARLQQENSILRDALNQATSQAESRQNAELARLRQDCVRLGRELAERGDALRGDEERRKSLEAKMAATEQELAKAQLLHADTEHALQQRLDEVCSELKTLKQEAAVVHELQGALVSKEAELQQLKVQLENQAAVQVDGASEVEQLKNSVQRRDEQICALEAELTQLRADPQLLKSSPSQRSETARNIFNMKKKLNIVKEDEVEAAADDQTQKDGSGSETDFDQPFESLEEDSQLLRLEEELQQLREELHQAHNHGNELQEKMAASAAAFSSAEHLSEQREAELKVALAEAESRFTALRRDFQASLQLLFPEVSVEAEQVGQMFLLFIKFVLKPKNQKTFRNRYKGCEMILNAHLNSSAPNDWLQRFQQKVQESKSEAESAQFELQSRLKETGELQAELEENRKLLEEKEAELQDLQRRSEEEENVWKNKLCEAEQQKQTVLDQLKLLEEEVQSTRAESSQKLKEQVMLLEAQLEKQLEEASFSQSCSEELAQVQAQVQQMSVRLQVEQEQRQQLDRELQQARQEVSELQQKMEADQRPAAPLEEASVEVKEETPWFGGRGAVQLKRKVPKTLIRQEGGRAAEIAVEIWSSPGDPQWDQ